MKLFVIQGYDGAGREAATTAHFRVHAGTRDQALVLVKSSRLSRRYGWFEVVDETDKFEVDEPGIVDEGTGPDIGVP
ncbi:MAG: hypothetical protein HY059_13285 [Proteobacteria bacterium]|nr:hypothetical protein [Pseudomonadota bacterium]